MTEPTLFNSIKTFRLFKVLHSVVQWCIVMLECDTDRNISFILTYSETLKPRVVLRLNEQHQTQKYKNIQHELKVCAEVVVDVETDKYTVSNPNCSVMFSFL